MKKVDLHIHTVSTVSDPNFEFDINILEDYVQSAAIDCIAITNHNTFDLAQFNLIQESLQITVFPGIEIDLEDGHILVISDIDELLDFYARCAEINKEIPTENDSISLAAFNKIFPDCSRYILIPHYDKKPSLNEKIIQALSNHITAGEVTSPKKFVYCIKDNHSLVPVHFSDSRVDKLHKITSTRQTYLNIGDTSFSSIRLALTDKGKVFLTKEEGHSFFEALQSGLRLSTGLNVIIGERSSGKSYTLNQIYNNFNNIKYIRQFSLLEREDNQDEERFNEHVRHKQSLFTQDYLKELQTVVNDMSDVDIESAEQRLDRFIESLHKHANESERADLFSKAALFNEVEFQENSFDGIQKLINAVEALIENTEYRDLIDKHLNPTSLKALVVDLIKIHTTQYESTLKKRWINDIITTIRKKLQLHTAATPIEEINFYNIAIEKEKVSKFNEIIHSARKERNISEREIQGFKVVTQVRPFQNATDLKSVITKKLQLTGAYLHYKDPYKFLTFLRTIGGLEETDYYKTFACVEYRILNRYGFEVSGGERSEFRLLQEISDAQQYDMLLIDEPESSFDNLFLKSEVNELIRSISKTMPVVIVTHNNTVGASIKPDNVIYTKRTVDNTSVKYEIYTGFPTDAHLVDSNGNKINNFDATMNCLEAGQDAYHDRRRSYEILQG